MGLKFNPDFVFYHIPKCGGSSVRRYIYEWFCKAWDLQEQQPDGKCIYDPCWIYFPEEIKKRWPPPHDMSDLEQYDHHMKFMDEDTIKNIKYILCHIKYDTSSIFLSDNPSRFDFTMIRHPVDRLISHYNHFDTNLYNGKQMDDLKLDELNEYCVGGRGRVMSNYLSLTKDASEEDIIATLRAFDFIGRLETISTDLSKLTLMLNELYNIDVPFPTVRWANHRNVSKMSYEDQYPVLYSKVYDLLEGGIDFKIYNLLDRK